ncbi:PAS domain-containing protein [Sinorhizobium sp. BG8]|uniref:PAS domain-containing protein n=1 Tax=Sinorhizobium sp. BG8 TaxID=2613773 RepID=UPI00193DE898|nr:PAS domain-containing protein [Sinorhizobium sp. BG8]
MADALRRLVANAPLLVDWIAADGRIRSVNDHEMNELGLEAGTVLDQPLEVLYGDDSARYIRSLLDGRRNPGEPFPVWMNSSAYEEVPMVAAAVSDEHGALAIIKIPLGPAMFDVGSELLERVEILSQMIGAATEACWCIEFLEPVDVSLGEDEIVDRIFSNQSRWRACNAAMAALYNVPEGLDFNTQPVSRYFPATAVNRAMVRDLVRSNYRLDHAAAVDQRHDGSEMLVENDFRAAIKDGFLIRLWGTTRDIGPHRRREQQLSERATSMLDILSAAPDPILVLAEDGVILAANPAAEQAWGRGNDSILGRPFEQLAEMRGAVARLKESAEAEEDEGGECDLSLAGVDGVKEGWRFRVARTEGEFRRYVLTARRKSRRKARISASEVL